MWRSESFERCRWAGVLVIAAVALITASAIAQPGGRGDRGGRGGFGGGFGRGLGDLLRPELMSRDMPFIVDELNLDDSQATIAEALLLDYRATFDEVLNAMRERAMDTTMGEVLPEERAARAEERRETFREIIAIREQIRALRERIEAGEGRDEEAAEQLSRRIEEIRTKFGAIRELRPSREERRAMLDGFADLAEDWLAERDRLRQQFMTDLQTVLNERQVERWPSFERALRRMKTLDRGEFAGERVDLLDVLETLDLEPADRERIEAVLEPYAIELDQALRARNDYLDESRPKLMDTMAAGDVERARTITQREIDLRLAVRRINETYVDAVTALAGDGLAAESAEAFRRSWREAAYPRVYRTTPMQRTFDAALELEDLDADAVDAIRAMRESYRSAIAVRNSALVQLIRQAEPQRMLDRLELIAARMDGVMMIPPVDPMRDAYADRREIERQYRSQLEAMLTAEQIEPLPAMRGVDGERRGRGRGRGDDRRGGWRERIRGFDANGDGILDEDEQQRMREAMRERLLGDDDDDDEEDADDNEG